MALSAARTSVLSRGNIKTLLGKHGGVLQVQVASVAHMKATWGGKYPYKKPWPYDSWKFNVLHELYDNSLARLNENSKVIVVEGNIGCGKNEFAQRLAKNFDLKFVPGITEDQVHSNNGFKLDMRILDDILPESAQQTTNLKVFHSDNPEEGIAGRLQYFYYAARFMQYCRAMLHLFNTGRNFTLLSLQVKLCIFTARKTPFFRRYCFQLRLYVVVVLCPKYHSFSQEILKIPQPNFQA